MKNLKFILVLTLVFLFTFPTFGQFGRVLRNAAERGASRAVEKRVEREAEKMASRQLDKIFKDVYGTDDLSTIPGFDIDKILNSIYTDVEVDPYYEFSGFVRLEIDGLDDDGKPIPSTNMNSFLSENQKITALEIVTQEKKSEDSYILIYDFNRNVAITLIENEGEKMRMAFAHDYADMGTLLTEEEDDYEDDKDFSDAMENVDFKKTGNTKVILGYDCEEYLIETDEYVSNYWVTKEALVGSESFWTQNNPFLTSRVRTENPDLFNNMPKGSMMEAYMVSKIDKGKIEMKVTEIDLNRKTKFDMDDYPSMTAMMKQ